MKAARYELSRYLPLREPTFYMLLSLSAGSKHGYAILKDIEELSRGTVLLSTSTLYEGLARLLDQGLIERVEQSDTDQGHPGRPRKDYRLSHLGARVLEAETRRMQALVAAAQQRLGKQSG
jgi:PadR family transcriptional regulator PadR